MTIPKHPTIKYKRPSLTTPKVNRTAPKHLKQQSLKSPNVLVADHANPNKLTNYVNLAVWRSPRFVAVEIMDGVLSGRSLNQLLPELTHLLSDADKRFVQHLVYETLRHYESLNDQLAQMMTTPIRTNERPIQLLLLLALFETAHMHTAEHACVNEWVNIVKIRRKLWAVSLCNAILRKITREGLPEPRTHLGKMNLPQWLWAKFSQDFPQYAQTMARHYTQHPVMTLRVNLNAITRENYLEELHRNDISAVAHRFVHSAIVLAKPTAVHNLPFFMQGKVSIQDAAAQWASILLNPQNGDVILDACAAPGGKTTHLLECATLKQLVALDIDPKRLEKVSENAQRIFGSHPEALILIAQDCLSYTTEQRFDRILLDAPCSGTGILHRHPDIKRLRTAADIEQLVSTQAQLLHQCWQLLKVGGMLLYSTCSSLQAENSQQMEHFFAHHSNAEAVPLTFEFGLDQTYGKQILFIGTELSEIMDGFYYCLIRKNAE